MVGPGGTLERRHASSAIGHDVRRRAGRRARGRCRWLPSPTTPASSSGAPDLTLTFVQRRRHRRPALHARHGRPASGSAIAERAGRHDARHHRPTSASVGAAAPSASPGEPAARRGRAGDRDPLRPRPAAHAPGHLPPERSWCVGVADDLPLRAAGSCHGWLGRRRAPTPRAARAPRWRRCSPAGPAAGHLQTGEVIVAVERHAGAHHGRAAGPPLRAAARAPRSRSRSSEPAPTTKVVDVTLGGSS